MKSVDSSTRDMSITTSTDWDGYLKLLSALEETHVRITYDRGKVELMSPSRLHERLKNMLRALVECWLEESGRDFEGGGSTTFRRRLLNQGVEPDECYWVRTPENARGPDVEEEIAPDLIIEVDHTSSSIDRLAIYGALGVPEVWRWTTGRGGKLHIYVLSQPGVYDAQPRGALLPDFPFKELERHVRLGLQQGQAAAVRAFRRKLQQG